MQNSDLHQDGTLKIGAVSRLTGLSTHTLRKWESRYGVVDPGRSNGGERIYTRADVERLSLVKRLVDAGVAPRDVASLTLEALTRRAEDISREQARTAGEDARPVRVVIVGSALGAMVDGQSPAPALLDVVASASSAADLDDALAHEAVEVLVVETPTVRGDTRRTVSDLLARCGAKAAVVVYRFGTRSDLQALRSVHVATLRAPADVPSLERAAVDLVRPHGASRPSTVTPGFEAEPTDDVPAPRLSPEMVARMARSSPRVRCECPHHLADIFLGLRAFEEYSEACENRSPEDAALHHYLWRSAARARAIFEDAIERVAAAEGISLRA